MKPKLGAFEFEIDIHGARVVAARKSLSSSALSDGELEWQIQALKNDLDALLPKMKQAIREQQAKPILESD